MRRTKISRAIYSSLRAGFLLSLIACGKKGDPLPPLRLAPAPAEEVTLRQVGDRLRLGWKAPSRNQDGTSLNVDLEGARLLRRIIDVPKAPPAKTEEAPAEEAASPAPTEKAPPAPAPSPPPFRSEAVVVAEVDSPKLGEAKVHEEPVDPAWIGKRVEYAVVYVNGKGRESPLSEVVRIDPVPALAPPGTPSAEARDGFVALSWSPPLEAPASLAFSVHRRQESANGYPEAPLNAEPLSATSFEDKTVVFGAASCYVVAAVLAPTSVSSLPSEEVCITPEDRFPPPVPSGLVAVPSQDAVLLSWSEVESPDRKGYRVYRGASPEGPFELLAEVSGSSYKDASAAPGERRFYAVTAIDDAPETNESALSEVVEARSSPDRERGREEAAAPKAQGRGDPAVLPERGARGASRAKSEASIGECYILLPRKDQTHENLPRHGECG